MQYVGSWHFTWYQILIAFHCLTIDCSEEIGRSKFNSMIGLVDRERVDEALYDDFETVKAREVCMLVMLILKFYSSV